MKIDKLKGGDLKKAAHLFIKDCSKSPYNQHWSNKQALNRIKDVYKGNKTYCLAAKEGKQLIGFVLGRDYQWHDGRRVFVEELIVDEKYRGRGVGSMLWAEFEKKLKKKGIVSAQVIINPKSRVKDFYKKTGLKKSECELYHKHVKRWL